MDDKVKEALRRLDMGLAGDTHAATIRAHIEALEAKAGGEKFAHEQTARKLAEATETWLDESTGTTWTVPTAWAYAQSCRVREEQRQRADKAEARVRELEGDAARYRWLLSSGKVTYRDGDDGCAWASMEWCVEVSSLAPQSLDAAIDSAMQGEEVRGG